MAHLNYEGLKRYDKKTKEYIEDKIKKINDIDVDELVTKAELDTKANKSDIFSGDYNDLTNKPNIPDTTNLAAKTDLATHTNNDNIHVTSTEKSKWNAKLENTDLKDYATKVYVTDEIAKASTSGTVDLTGYAKTADVNVSLNTKVDKVTGKSLVSDTEIERLKNVDNYDDSSIKTSIANINTQLNTKANKSDLFSGNYNDLTNKPTIGTENMGTSATTIKGAIKEHEEQINNIDTQLNDNANKITDIKTDLEATNTNVAKNTTDLAVQKARMDTFTKLAEGSTTGDAELVDARVGADGVTYKNVGSAIREQLTDLKNDIGNLIEQELELNMFYPLSLGRMNSSGVPTKSQKYGYTSN